MLADSKILPCYAICFFLSLADPSDPGSEESQLLTRDPSNLSRDLSNASRDPSNLSRDPSNQSRDPSNLSRDPSNLSRDPSNLSRDLSYLDPEVTAAFRCLPVETFTYSAFAPAPGCGEAVVVVGGETEVWQILGRFSIHFGVATYIT
jgi:hypothetical protein